MEFDIEYEYAIYDGKYYVEAKTVVNGVEHALRTPIGIEHNPVEKQVAEELVKTRLIEEINHK